MPYKDTSRKKKHLPVPCLILLDIVLIAATLLTYALFQHVIPSLFVSNVPNLMDTETSDTPNSVDYVEPFIATPPPPAIDVENEITDSSVDLSAEGSEEHESVSTSETPPVAPVETKSSEYPWTEKFADHFTDNVIITDTSYSSPNIAVELRDFTTGEGKSIQHWVVEDIYISDISFFQTWTPGGYYSSKVSSITHMSDESRAVAAINGDYAAFSSGGYVIRNGILRRNDVSLAEVCALYSDGHMETFEAGSFDADKALKDGAWQAWTFGPSLLNEDGIARESFPDIYSSISRANPRTAIGYYEPGHYCFLVADGRQVGTAGLTLEDLAQVMQNLGCAVAYNLDGGASSQMTLNGRQIITRVDGNRVINDVLIIREESAGENQ